MLGAGSRLAVCVGSPEAAASADGGGDDEEEPDDPEEVAESAGSLALICTGDGPSTGFSPGMRDLATGGFVFGSAFGVGSVLAVSTGFSGALVASAGFSSILAVPSLNAGAAGRPKCGASYPPRTHSGRPKAGLFVLQAATIRGLTCGKGSLVPRGILPCMTGSIQSPEPISISGTPLNKAGIQAGGPDLLAKPAICSARCDWNQACCNRARDTDQYPFPAHASFLLCCNG